MTDADCSWLMTVGRGEWHEKLSVARELMRWVDALPHVLAKIDQVLKLPDITETQAKHLESMAERVGTMFLGHQGSGRFR
jgi:hypothetical protein